MVPVHLIQKNCIYDNRIESPWKTESFGLFIVWIKMNTMSKNQKNTAKQNKVSNNNSTEKADKEKEEKNDNKKDSKGDTTKDGVSRHPTTETNPEG